MPSMRSTLRIHTNLRSMTSSCSRAPPGLNPWSISLIRENILRPASGRRRERHFMNDDVTRSTEVCEPARGSENFSTARKLMRATWHGETIAESDQTIVVEGNHYFPEAAVR